MSPVSATYWGIPGYVIFWVLFAIAFGLFSQRFYFLFRLMRLGKPGEPLRPNRGKNQDDAGRGGSSVVHPENRHPKGPGRDRARSVFLVLHSVLHELYHLYRSGRRFWTLPMD